VYYYSAFNLCIASHIELPFLPPADYGGDVMISLAPRDPHAGPPPEMAQAFHVTPRLATLDYASLGTLTVRGGRELRVTLLPAADESRLPGYLIATALAVLLYQRGLLVLQASAVAVAGVAAVFMAGSGGGKSTLAAKLHQQGHGLLAEDITAIDMRSGKPHVIPAAPLLQLDGQSAAALGIAEAGSNDASQGKRVRLIEHGFARSPTPLRTIYHLQPGTDNNIGYIPLPAGLTALSYHSYPTCLMQPSSQEHLRQCSRLVGAVMICELTRRCELADLGEQAQMIEDHLATQLRVARQHRLA
jgi:hypothetical protein